jgi:hypothetical protein
MAPLGANSVFHIGSTARKDKEAEQEPKYVKAKVGRKGERQYMSTPSGKSFDPIDPSAGESRETEECAAARRRLVESNYGPLQIVSHDTDAPRIHAGNTFHEEQPPPAAREMARDLTRLAASVRWVQREEAAARLRRDAQSRFVPAFAPVDAGGRDYGEMFDGGFSSRSPEPDGRVPPSAIRLRRDNLRGPLNVLIVSISVLMVSIFAVPIAYYLSAGSWSPTSKSPPRPQMTSLGSRFVTPPISSRQESSRTIVVRDDDPEMLAEGEITYERAKLSPGAKSFAHATVATLPPSTPGAQDPPAVRTLDPDEIMLLMKQGQQFIAAGDVLAARITFQRAAEAGDADAAVALGATYDPTALAMLGVVGMSADVAEARSWYEKAGKFDSLEARWRLDSNNGGR